MFNLVAVISDRNVCDSVSKIKQNMVSKLFHSYEYEYGYEYPDVLPFSVDM